MNQTWKLLNGEHQRRHKCGWDCFGFSGRSLIILSSLSTSLAMTKTPTNERWNKVARFVIARSAERTNLNLRKLRPKQSYRIPVSSRTIFWNFICRLCKTLSGRKTWKLLNDEHQRRHKCGLDCFVLSARWFIFLSSRSTSLAMTKTPID